MAAIEKRMRELDILETKSAKPFLPESDKTPDRFSRSYIDDDHAPFLHRGVEVLHMIPTPFPAVWHKIEDDGEHLDLPTVRDWARITTAFVVDWMSIQEHMPNLSGTKAKRDNPAETIVMSKRTEL